VRIDCIDLIRFGHFVNRKIEFPSTNLDYYLIYGDNEAGKSTLLRGISALFFGVPSRTPDVHSCKSSELRIGATISDREKSFSFRRRKGTTGTLLNRDEEQIQDSALNLFLQELDRERFEQFFGLNHHRLREGGEELLRGKGDIGSALFQATGLLDLRNLLDGLDSEAKELFSAKSRTKTISRAIDEYKQARSEVRRFAISATTVKQKQTELDTAREALEKQKTESQSLQQELVRLRRIASNKPDVARLHELRATLLGLETTPALPRGTRRQRDEAVAALVDATSQIKTLSEHIAERKERIGAVPVSNLFKVHTQEIEELNGGTSDYARSVTDRPKRLSERDEAIQLAEAEWKEIWHRRPVSDAEELRSTYSRKAEILALITEHARLSTALTQAEEQLRAGRDEQNRLDGELALHPNPADPSPLIATIEQAKALGDTDHAIGRLKSEIERLTSGANRDLKALRQWSGSIRELDSLKTPLLTTIDRYGREWETMAAARKSLTFRLSEITSTIEKEQIELNRLTAEVGRVGVNELVEVRGRRDQLWKLIRASAFDGTASIEDAQKQSGSDSPLAESFSEYLRHADEISDQRFANAKDVAIHDRLVKEINSFRGEKQRVEQELTTLEAEDRELRQRWTEEWGPLGLALLSPAEMKEWMQSRQVILDRTEQSREKENDLRVLEVRVATAAGGIEARLADVGLQLGYENEPLSVLIKVGEASAKKLEEQLRAIENIRRGLLSLLIEKRQATLDECKRRLAEWSQRWSPLVSALLLPEGSTPDQVGEGLAVLEKVFGHLRDAEHLNYRLKRIGDNIEVFEKRVSQLVAAIAPSIGPLAPAVAVTQLHLRLVETGKAETQREELEAQNGKDGAMILTYSSKAKAASDTLTKLKELAKCDDDQALETRIAASEKRTEKKEEYDRIAVGLIERNAVSDVRQVEEESSGYELDSLQSDIVSSEDRLKALQDEVFKTGTEHGRLLEEFERLQSSDESTVQAQKAEDALARVRPAVGQYLRLRLASEVLQRAIESYREKHQGPVLTRASELFSSLTLGDHCGLTTGFGDDDKSVLVAIRKNKEQVQVEGLSDGTRDQLYLALRLAAIEHHVQTVAPCPVVFDDILINSDDSRATVALEVIGELAKYTQVLFFTHHRRLADLGEKAGGRMIELRLLAPAALVST
jgi:uncharacterized protein YhaN